MIGETMVTNENVSNKIVEACGEPTASAGGELIYGRDENGFYCTPMALECACMRGYQECMMSNDCHQSSEDLLVSLELCENRGCSALQCGLAPYENPLACQHQFIGCLLKKDQDGSGEGRSCHCTHQYVACQASNPWLLSMRPLALPSMPPHGGVFAIFTTEAVFMACWFVMRIAMCATYAPFLAFKRNRVMFLFVNRFSYRG